jgi:hypothetical protein
MPSVRARQAKWRCIGTQPMGVDFSPREISREWRGIDQSGLPPKISMVAIPVEKRRNGKLTSISFVQVTFLNDSYLSTLKTHKTTAPARKPVFDQDGRVSGTMGRSSEATGPARS